MTWLVENKKIYTYCRKLRTKLSIHINNLTYVLYVFRGHKEIDGGGD